MNTIHFRFPYFQRRPAERKPAALTGPIRLGFGLALLALAWLPMTGLGQWQTQTNVLKPGWNAVYLHVDASYTNLDYLIGSNPANPISQVWLWQPPSSVQFVSTPDTPSTASSQWSCWGRTGVALPNTLAGLAPNAAYLVYSTAATNYTWLVQGRPVGFTFTWSTTGLNFLGFPTPSANPPAFDSFVSLSPVLKDINADIYAYNGGNLSTTNPSKLFNLHGTAVTRGRAFWVRNGTQANTYFGPFTVDLQGSKVDFRDTSSRYSVHLRNVAATNVTVTVRLLVSETPPAGQTNIAGLPPLLIRGAQSMSDLTYASTNLGLGTTHSWVLTPAGQSGSDVQVVFGLNRFLMPGAPGTTYAGILQFTDSFGFEEQDVAVSATVSSSAGLWVGKANVSQVANYMKTYQLDTNGATVLSTNGSYIVTSVNTNLGTVVTPYPLMLILHNDGINANLLQRVFYGQDRYSNSVVALNETALDPNQLSSARRISAAHLPFRAPNAPWPMTGLFGQGTNLTATISLAYNDQVSNPFLHTYHPDHDNLDATFSMELAQGMESYGLQRQITLTFSPPGNDFNSLTGGATAWGYYQESITVQGFAGAQRNFNVAGTFSLNRLSSIATLTGP